MTAQRRIAVLLASALGLLTLLLAPAAYAAKPGFKATAGVLAAGDTARLQVKLKPRKRLTAATRPRSVRVTAGGVVYPLKAAGKKGKKALVWRSKVLRGPAAAALAALAGRRVSIKIRTKSGAVRVGRALTVPAGPKVPGGGGAGPREPEQPERPPEETPQQKAERFRQMLEGKRFYYLSHSSSSTTSSTYEERVDFCPGGRFNYREDSSANTSYQKGWSGSWRVESAEFLPDGSAKGRIIARNDPSTFYAYVNGANDTSESPPPDAEGPLDIEIRNASTGFNNGREYSIQSDPACG